MKSSRDRRIYASDDEVSKEVVDVNSHHQWAVSMSVEDIECSSQ